MKQILKFLIFLPVYFIFLPSFSFQMPFLYGVYSYFFIFLYIAIFIMLVTNRANIIKKIKRLIKITPFNILSLTLILIIFNSLFLALIGVARIGQTVHSLLMQIVLYIFPILLYFIMLIGTYISVKSFVRLYFKILWFVLLLGFLEYIGQLFNISFIINLFNNLANARILSVSAYGLSDIVEASNYMAFGIPRLDGFFEEPSGYAKYIYILLPIVYSLTNKKIKIAKNKILNFLILKTFIPFTWISIILTFSPIYLIFSIIITVIYYYKYILKYFLFIFTGIILIALFIFFNIDLSEIFTSRIINLFSIKNFNDFIEVEPSLATRVLSYIASILVFIKHPLTGCGINNMGYEVVEVYNSFPLPLTNELINNSQRLLANGRPAAICKSFVYMFLAEHGFLILCVFVYFYYKLLKFLKNMLSKYKLSTFYFALYKGLYFSFIDIIIISFYNLSILEMTLYLLFSIVVILIYQNKILLKYLSDRSNICH